MADKKYFWLKLKDDFFRNKEIKKLRRVAGGDTYTIIYLKMQLLSIKNEGKIYFEGIEDSLAGEIALELDENEEDVKMTLIFLNANSLIERVDDDVFLMNRVPESIGNETDAAERMRRLRSKKSVTMLPDVTSCYTEKRIEDIEKEKEKEGEIKKKDIDDFFESVWKLYPVKKGKAGVSETQKKKLYAIGYDELKRAIERYDSEVKDKQYMKHGSTFFNGGYVDYLDANYQEPEKKDEPNRYDNAMFRAIGRGVTNV